MTVDPAAVASQGFRFSAIYIAVQGLIAFIAGGGSTSWIPIFHRRRRRM
jgi:hypothetical protein